MLTRLLTASAVLLALAPSAIAAPAIHAHRGGTVVNGKAKFGEESYLAYKAAARHGFVLEVDAKLAKDGVPVAIHDATLDRTTNCTGEVRSYTGHGLRACRTDFPAGRPTPIMTIKAVLEFAKLTGSRVNLEIKNVPTDPDYDSTPGYANKVMDAVIASGIPRRQLIVQSFIAANLDVARQRLPGVTTSLLAVKAINEPYLQAAADGHYDLISPEWPVSGDYVRRAHGMGLAVAPFTLNAAADVRAARSARVDALITDDPLMAARTLGMRPVRHFTAFAFLDGRRLVATGDVLTPRGVSARQGCRGTVTMRVMAPGSATRSVRGKLNRNCEFRFSTRRPRLVPRVTISFNGNARLLPQLEGPKGVDLKPPVFRP